MTQKSYAVGMRNLPNAILRNHLKKLVLAKSSLEVTLRGINVDPRVEGRAQILSLLFSLLAELQSVTSSSRIALLVASS